MHTHVICSAPEATLKKRNLTMNKQKKKGLKIIFQPLKLVESLVILRKQPLKTSYRFLLREKEKHPARCIENSRGCKNDLDNNTSTVTQSSSLFSSLYFHWSKRKLFFFSYYSNKQTSDRDKPWAGISDGQFNNIHFENEKKSTREEEWINKESSRGSKT